MQAKIIRVLKTSTVSDMPTNEEETFQEKKLEVSASVLDAPEIPAGTGRMYVPDHIRISESFTAYTPEDECPAHWRIVVVSGFLVRKDGTVGKIRTEEHFRTYSTPDISGSLTTAPQAVQDISALLVPPFQRGTFTYVLPQRVQA